MRTADGSNFKRRSSGWLAKGTGGAIEVRLVRTRPWLDRDQGGVHYSSRDHLSLDLKRSDMRTKVRDSCIMPWTQWMSRPMSWLRR